VSSVLSRIPLGRHSRKTKHKKGVIDNELK